MNGLHLHLDFDLTYNQNRCRNLLKIKKYQLLKLMVFSYVKNWSYQPSIEYISAVFLNTNLRIKKDSPLLL